MRSFVNYTGKGFSSLLSVVGPACILEPSADMLSFPAPLVTPFRESLSAAPASPKPPCSSLSQSRGDVYVVESGGQQAWTEPTCPPWGLTVIREDWTACSERTLWVGAGHGSTQLLLSESLLHAPTPAPLLSALPKPKSPLCPLQAGGMCWARVQLSLGRLKAMGEDGVLFLPCWGLTF